MLQFVLLDKTSTFIRLITPNTSHVELLWDAVSFAELEFDDDDPIWAAVADGARVRALFDGQPVMCGPVITRRGNAPMGSSTMLVEDDFRMFRSLGWPNPASPLTAQTSEYRRYSGPTETIVKTACQELSDRLGLGWTITPTLGRGTSQRIELRMHPLVDKFTVPLKADRLTWTISDGVVDVVDGDTFPRVLTPDSGVLGNYRWEISYPEATRVVVGGEGEGTDRLFQQFIDTTREAHWGSVVDVFKDSRMAQGITDLSTDGAEALAEGAPKVSVSTDLIENSWFRFGRYHVGDKVAVNIGPIDTVEVITRVVMDDGPADGLVVVPHLGEAADTPDDKTAAAIASLARGVRDQEKR
ncbi:siphovirus ReqiPepy6 Gp37-like family protein [Microbacterium allomyrinae]|uniref:Gp28/Gp37-like domain-containing protein n=1 Tax=Microbacterium allomyrinae TaxID=2830666 RepID=A0A9X1LUB2_9MICO|nr:siphovirus ReqiPepy6 Gp37-like family protein [Microbacterium allomyrinae]MCC2031836.1 hypothetical protein [Microbacterium allomyrinae]